MVIKERDAASSSFIGADGIRVYRVKEPALLSAVTWNDRAPGIPWTNAGGTYEGTPLSIIAEPAGPYEPLAEGISAAPPMNSYATESSTRHRFYRVAAEESE